MKSRRTDITDLEEFDDISEFYFEDDEDMTINDWEDNQEDNHSFRPISEL